jgi:hypothetical protein
MHINPAFKKLPYWLKGTFLGFFVLIILILILGGFAMTKCPPTNLTSAYCETLTFNQESLILWLVPNNSIIKTLEANVYNTDVETNTWLYVDVVVTLLFPLIGSIVGLIYGLFKNKIKK